MHLVEQSPLLPCDHETEIARLRLALEISEQNLEACLAAIPQSAHLLDKEGMILASNRVSPDRLGIGLHEYVGTNIFSHLPMDVRQIRRAYFDKVITTKTSVSWDDSRENGSYTHYALPVLDETGEVSRVVHIAVDITERKRAEQELQQYAEDLELFVGIATHDLQEPVRGIVIFSQILLTQIREGKGISEEKYLEKIETAGLQMSALINDLRMYSRIQVHHGPMDTVDLEVCLSHALDQLQISITESGALVTHDPLPVISADAPQMTQVFQNLIGNAIKFKEKGVAPMIHISAVPLDGMWEIAVRDNGIGIPEAYYDKIFVLFERLHKKDTYPGTGLGLALCKRIIKRHGGQIWVESRVGKGSSFHFTIPA